jgi:predicted NBD/HSP70 family sugar kinase
VGRYNENEKLLLAKLRQLGPTTKYILAEKLKISIPTVTTNINRLIKNQMIKEVGFAQVDFGRKPVLLDIRLDKHFSLGLDIQTKSIYYCFMNLKLEVVAEGKMKKDTPDLQTALLESIEKSLTLHGIKKENLVGIGISYPGIVDSENLILKTSTHVGQDATSLVSLQEIFGVPIKIGNEANLAAFAENIIGEAKPFSNSIYLSINEGIGGGIILDKHYYSGSFHAAGEIGHMIVEKGGRGCSCGAHGCLEAYLSTTRLIDSFNDAYGTKFDTLEEVFDAFSLGNAGHKELLHHYLDYLVIALNNLFLMFDPDCIILGGELSSYRPYIEEYISHCLLLDCSRLLSKNRKILFSKLEYKSSKLGAALVALEDVIALSI